MPEEMNEETILSPAEENSSEKENSVEIVESEEDELEESTEKESFDMLGTNNIALNAQIFSSIAAQDNVLRMNKNSKEK